MVMGTPDGVDRILNNLISNAIKYTPSGGKVTVYLSRSAGEAEVIVDDTGIGIPDEAMEKLFDEFYRAPNAKLLVNEGTGLGLTITKDIINRLGGRLNVQSTLDKGTRVVVILPLADIAEQSESRDGSLSKVKAT